MRSPVVIDIIILSYAKDEQLRELTAQTVHSVLNSEDPSEILFNVVVIESNKALKPYSFEHTTTIYPDVPFGYNRFLNIGLKATTNAFVCLCNNDLIFHEGWAKNILKQMNEDVDLLSVNPYCPITHINSIDDKGQNVISTQPGILIGWCIFIKRELLNTIGYFDEHFKFWYADNDYGCTLVKHQIKHALVTSSKVTHLGSKTHTLLSESDLFEYTYGQFLYFDLKWNNKSSLVYSLKQMVLPVFRYLYLTKKRSNLHMLGCRAMAKLYGGLK